MTMNHEKQPKLQPPGAGLPFVQRVLLRFWLGPVVSRRTPSDVVRQNYENLTRKIIEKIKNIPPEKRLVKVLVDPMPGLEDSSRYWSLNEVMEHLLIVSRGIESTILSLSSGTLPNGKADTAKMKPGKADQDLLSEYSSYGPALMKSIDERLSQPGMNFDSKLKFAHPWFGGFTARQWYWLLSTHQAIHYRQTKAIIQGLGSSKT
jgi:hypothetical protein